MTNKTIKISPSLLSANINKLDEEVIGLCKAGADFLHLDMMDGRFVPNITFDEEFVRKVKAVSTIPLDVHLMIEDVELHAEKYVKAGADILTIHLESKGFSVELLRYIKSLPALSSRRKPGSSTLGQHEHYIDKNYNKLDPGFRRDDMSFKKLDHRVKVGVSIKPATPASALKDVIKDVDLILVMTVEPGFGGQKFLHSQLHKIKEIRTMADKKIDISVDGGINPETAKLCVKAGANILVSGSYIFADEAEGYSNKINALRCS